MHWKFDLSRQSDVFALAVSVEYEHVETSVASTSYPFVFIKKKNLLKKTMPWLELHAYCGSLQNATEGKMIFAAFQSRLEFYSSEEQILSKAHDHKRLIPIF